MLALGSVGGLRRELGAGTFLCPDDFIALDVGSPAFEDERAHSVPGFDPAGGAGWSPPGASRAGSELLDGGVYWQTRGPRLETPAEIRMIAAARRHGRDDDRLGVRGRVRARARYAAICVVDNLANGVGETELTMEEFEAGRARNRERSAARGAIEPELSPALA